MNNKDDFDFENYMLMDDPFASFGAQKKQAEPKLTAEEEAAQGNAVVKNDEMEDMLDLAEENLSFGEFENAKEILEGITKTNKYPVTLWQRNHRVWWLQLLIECRACEADELIKKACTAITNVNLKKAITYATKSNSPKLADYLRLEKEFRANASVEEEKNRKAAEEAEEQCKQEELLRQFKIENGVLLKYFGEDANVTIPKGVTSIAEYAFCDCKNLNTITIPDGVKSIGDRAFNNCENLASITISESVNIIGCCTFVRCGKIVQFNIVESNPYYCSVNGVLFSKDMKTLYRYPSGKIDTYYCIPNGVTTIENRAFQESNITSITIPNSVTRIGEGAFFGCSLVSVNIPNSVTEIENFTFGYCSNNLISIIIPNSVTSIGDSAFCECGNLVSITIPNSVISIGEKTFYACRNLASVAIPNSVTNIGKESFGCCYKLTSITIPNSVTSIGENVFGGSDDIKTIYAPAHLRYYFENTRLAYSCKVIYT